jgi:hypothetical protein
MCRLILGPTQSPVRKLLGTFYVVVKWLKYEADYASLSGSRSKKEWSSASTYTYAFMCGWGWLYLFMKSLTCCKINSIFKDTKSRWFHQISCDIHFTSCISDESSSQLFVTVKCLGYTAVMEEGCILKLWCVAYIFRRISVKYCWISSSYCKKLFCYFRLPWQYSAHLCTGHRLRVMFLLRLILKMWRWVYY